MARPVPTRDEFAALPLARRLAALQDPMNFLRYAVYTKDEVNAKEPVRPAPVWPGVVGYKPYIEPITRIWEEYSTIVIDKSRRLWMSYLMLTLHLHLAMTNTDRRVGIMSKKFEDSAAHLETMRNVYEAIPETVWPMSYRPKMRVKEGFIYFDEIGSIVHGIASGPDQARQFGYSAIFWDEMDFCEQQELTYGALAPTLQNGGKLSIASTHSFQDSGVESFYRRFLEDRD